MNRSKPWRTAGVWSLAGAGMLAAALVTQAAPPMGRPPVDVELPAFIPGDPEGWLYATCEGAEVLALAPVEATRAYVQNIAQQRANLDALLPEDLRLSWERPITVLLYAQDNPEPLPGDFGPLLAGIHTERERERAAENREGKPLQVVVRPHVIPGIWVPDADGIGFFNAIAPKLKASELSALPAPQYISYLLDSRNPPLPAWLTDGISSFFAQATLIGAEVDVQPAIWISPAQSMLMARDKSIPAEFLPLAEVFAYVNPGSASSDERRMMTIRSEAALLVRWAMEGRAPGGADALWTFARGLRPGADTAALFKASFGISTEDAVDALKAYLPQALRKRARIRVRDARPAAVEIRSATPAEVARLRGEWERLAGVLVLGLEPSLRPHYEERARRTLASGPDNVAADPELLAARGLMAVESGDDDAALPLLEAACRSPRPRPRAVVELARIRLARARAALPEDGRLDAAASAPIVDALRSVLGSRPPMPRAYQVLADTWGVAEVPPTAEELELLVSGVRTIPANVGLVLSVARLLIDLERPEQAREVIDTGLAYVTEDAGRRRLFAMRSGLRGVPRK